MHNTWCQAISDDIIIDPHMTLICWPPDEPAGDMAFHKDVLYIGRLQFCPISRKVPSVVKIKEGDFFFLLWMEWYSTLLWIWIVIVFLLWSCRFKNRWISQLLYLVSSTVHELVSSHHYSTSILFVISYIVKFLFIVFHFIKFYQYHSYNRFIFFSNLSFVIICTDFTLYVYMYILVVICTEQTINGHWLPWQLDCICDRYGEKPTQNRVCRRFYKHVPTFCQNHVFVDWVYSVNNLYLSHLFSCTHYIQK